MNAEQHGSLGIYSSNSPSMARFSSANPNAADSAARQLYEKSVATLKEADFMAVHSSTSTLCNHL